MEITIWDLDQARIREIERNLCIALRKLGQKPVIRIISEPPLISRENLLHRVPVLEISDHFWSLRPQTVITQEQCHDLVCRILRDRTQDAAENKSNSGRRGND